MWTGSDGEQSEVWLVERVRLAPGERLIAVSPSNQQPRRAEYPFLEFCWWLTKQSVRLFLIALFTMFLFQSL